jgi:hypothetical protein
MRRYLFESLPALLAAAAVATFLGLAALPVAAQGLRVVA